MATEHLPEELVVMILVRLPVKSLVRFRSLSNDCDALIRKTSFITEHLSHSIVKAKNMPSFLLFHQTNKFFISLVSEDEQSQPSAIDQNPPFIFVTPPFTNQTRFSYGDFVGANKVTVHAHFNGIIYLEQFGVPRYHNPLILWNPATREVKFLPIPPLLIPSSSALFNGAHGFGIDPKKSDYKIIKVVMGTYILWKESDEKLSCQVYSLRSDSWKVVNTGILACFIYKSMFNAYLNGAYHWLAQSGDVEFVLCFDMSDDVFWKMNLPNVSSHKNLSKKNVVVLNDCVGYVREYNMFSEIRFKIWVMNEYGVEGSWVVMFNVVDSNGPEKLLEFWKDDDDVVLGGETHHPLVLYKIGEQQVVKEFPDCLGMNYRAVRYVESIVPLSGLVDEEA